MVDVNGGLSISFYSTVRHNVMVKHYGNNDIFCSFNGSWNCSSTLRYVRFPLCHISTHFMPRLDTSLNLLLWSRPWHETRYGLNSPFITNDKFDTLLVSMNYYKWKFVTILVNMVCTVTIAGETCASILDICWDRGWVGKQPTTRTMKKKR